MKKIYKLLLLMLLVCFSCKKEEPRPKIEIYLLDKKIEPTVGIWLKETEYYENLDSIEKSWYGNRRVDTIAKEIIDGAEFEVTGKDIPAKPFIADNEIKKFDLKKNIITFDYIVVQRLKNLRPHIDNTQFVITLNKKPLITGYFWSTISSQTCNWYSIIVVDPFGLDKASRKTKSYWSSRI